MAKSMFQSYKGSLFFAGSTLLGVALLVGSEDKEGALVLATSEMERQSALMEQQEEFASSSSASANRSNGQGSTSQSVTQPSETFEFTPDDQLIDDTQGFDPTPSDNGFASYEPAWDQQ